MKVGKNYFEEKHSSFLSLEKDYSLIMKRIFENDQLCKLLYYTQKDCLKAPDLTSEQKLSMINNQIKIVPVTKITQECPTQLIIVMDGFAENATNPEFKDCVVVFHILCHPDHWNLGNFALRPYKIAGEIDAMINDKKLTGIGPMQFVGGNNLTMNDQAIGISLGYGAVHGIEDKINPLS